MKSNGFLLKITWYRIFIIVFLIMFVSGAQAQSPYFKKILVNRENGNLKSTRVIHGKDGYLWVGTNEGVYKYDGTDPVLFSIANKEFDNTVSALYQDDMDTLWVGYTSGQVAYEVHGKLNLLVPEEGLPKKAISCLSKDKHGYLWIATTGEGLYYYDHKRLHNVNTDDGLNDNYVYALAPDPFGNMWAGTDEGIALLTATSKNKVVKSLHKHDGLPDNIIRVLVPDEQGNLWIGMQEKGICKYIVADNRIQVPSQVLNWKFGQVNSISLDQPDLWVGTEEFGMIYLDGKPHSEAKSYQAFNSLRFSKITDSNFDSEGNIWMVANGSLMQSSGSKIMLLDSLRSVSLNNIHALLYDHSDHLWFTPDQGLVRFSFSDTGSKSIQQYTITAPVDLIDIVCLYEDECQYLWVGTMGDGLYRLNPENKKVQKFTGNSLLNKASVMSIAGKGNTIWVATLGGAVKIELPADCNTDQLVPVFENLDSQDLLGSFYLYDVFIDSKGKVWFGTDGKGLTCLDHGSFINYSEKNGLKNNAIYSITEDEFGNIWFSTAHSGIYKYDGVTFKNYTLLDGLRYLSISSIESDGKGNIIIVHKHGFDVFNINHETFLYNGSEIGIADFNSDLNAITKDQNGHIYIGAEDQIVRYSNHSYRYAQKPNAVINNVSLFTNELEQVANNRLAYDQNYLSFEFSGLWYTNPDRVKYKYLLEGYSKDWVPTRDRKAIFPNLPPGKYTFKVRTSLNRNFNQYTEAAFAFQIKAPFWKENWFFIMSIFLGSVVIYLFIKTRISQIRKLESLKKEKIEYQYETLRSQVNPHFLFNSFNTLITTIENDKEAAIEYVENLSSFFRHIVTYKDHDLITLEEELAIASDYFFLQQKRYGKNLTLDIKVSDSSKKREIPPMVLQILIENTLKHNAISYETPLQVTIQDVENKLEIRNNINVKRMQEVSTRSGLHNIINRYKLLTSEEVEIISDEKEFLVKVPLIG